MRIAVSGTHFIGKSTLIKDFVDRHPKYKYEIEPYYKLQEEGAGELLLDTGFESFLKQLDIVFTKLNVVNRKRILFLIGVQSISCLMLCVL